MAFTRKDRQRIIDGYLSQTGRNLFVASEFVDWLQGEPEHEAHEWFFGMGDAEAARQHRISMARQMASGLRIKTEVEVTEAQVVRVKEREFPAYLSPVDGRKHGGGYERFNPESAEAVAELRRQGRTALASWLNRYRGAFSELDLSMLEEIAATDDEPQSSDDRRVAQSA